MHYSKFVFIALYCLFITGCGTSASNSTTSPTNTLAATIRPATVTLAPTITATPKPTRTLSPTRTPVFDYSHYEIDPKLEEIAHNFPTVASSTSAQPLWVEIICHIFDVYCPWTLGEIGPEWSNQFHQELTQFIWQHGKVQGTHEAYMALINGDVDIILVARAPSHDELTTAQSMSVSLDARPVALDAFVFLVNSQNTVDNLSLEQLRQIYSGKITKWRQVGGKDQEIHAYQREENSGSQELMNTLVMSGTPLIDAPEMIVYTMEGPFNAIGTLPFYADLGSQGDVAGIGYSVYYYAKYMTLNDGVEFIGVNGVEPTSATIRNRTYPLTSEVYAVVRTGQSSQSPAIKLRDWLLTNDGQYAISLSGYVPIEWRR